MTSALTNQRRVFKARFTQTERVFDDVTRKIGPLDFTTCFVVLLQPPKLNLRLHYSELLQYQSEVIVKNNCYLSSSFIRDRLISCSPGVWYEHAAAQNKKFVDVCLVQPDYCSITIIYQVLLNSKCRKPDRTYLVLKNSFCLILDKRTVGCIQGYQDGDI